MINHLKQGWPPEQIAGRIRIDLGEKISHEAIYQYVYFQFDNGPENQNWSELKQASGADCFFTHPYHSWERGTNENTNGLVRWYFPKGVDFRTIPDKAIKVVEHALNTRPRKRLNWLTPLEVFNQFTESVALTD